MGMEYFGDKLRALRMKKNLTQNDLAARLGIVGASVSSYEKNKQYPSVEVLIQLCQTFDVSADYLLGLSDDKNFNTSTLTEEQLQIVLRLINEFEQSNVLKER
ncbi:MULTISPECIES: helix-turn-helix domain-containing protein [Lactococcus]|jgi:transcriptional regulator with XRE-family HTH domain|uniref:XRE family transcriptional regulator n=2 Tax=Lactococcus lactis TaxID=1358 RepID=A0A443LB56_9LACT|nr:helix-turn-helix transcriptional regulator [Lactococcus lactis]KRO22209.1 transcription regulator [Lactococcus lactis subsp. lactis]NYZ59269.1 helix-turn-helix transcriptional regulator [Lactococcus lactis]RWR46364.1 XRE family transcriptional regulator [Lactococcus lactis]UTG79343.1 helix-turn-helix domain-containing protein [Lactococcus lactis]